MELVKKYRVHLLLLSIALITLFVINISFRKTYILYSKVSQNELLLKSMYSTNNTNKEINDTASARFVLGKGQYNELIINRLSALCAENYCKLVEISSENESEVDGVLLHTVVFNIKGSFHQLMKMVYDIEKGRIDGNASSIRFFIKQDIVTKKKELILNITLQFILNE